MSSMSAVFWIIFLSFSIQLANSTLENCSTNVPPGGADPQPPIVMYTFQENFTTIELPESSGARCLDGTNYKFYFIEGSGSGKDKWMFYWQGAAFCGADGRDAIQSCYERSQSQYGSGNSSYWGENQTVTTVKAALGWFSSMEEYNPKFYNWNKVELISCDGVNHQGSIEEPVYFNNTYLYFRGMNNTLATLEFLRENHGLFEAKDIILGGGSMGAIAAFIWTAYLQDYFPRSIRLSGILDAGLFVDSYSEINHCHLYRYFMQSLSLSFNLSTGVSSTLYRKCDYRNTTEFWKCLMIQYIYENVTVPIFVINSQDDFKQLTNLNSIGCLNAADGGATYCNASDRIMITKLREEFLRLALQIKKAKPLWGFWLRACFEHTYQFTWGWYGHEMDVFSAELQTSSNIKDALYFWYDNFDQKDPAGSFIDLVDWLHNPLCHYGPNQYDQEAA